MNSLTLRSPAKLNLFLKIIRRRPDGYHDLVTLFHRISLCDKISLSKKPAGFSLTADSSFRLPLGETNLITKAYRALRQRFKRLGGVAVHLEKNIPVGGGLGGGSSNAASFLFGMKKMWDLKISRQGLVRLGAELGADVPFFLYDTTQALAEGIGESIKPIPANTRRHFLLLISRRGLSTKQVYQNLAPPAPPPSLTRQRRIARLLAEVLDEKKLDQAAALMENDLEESAFRLRPSLLKCISKLNEFGIRTARMSGSGPTVFAILPYPEEAQTIAQKLRRLLPAQKIVVCHSY